MMRGIARWARWLIALLYFYMENSYFGWNMLPMSDAEMICDGIGLIILALAYEHVP